MKKRRKPRPQPPKYYWLETDNCWKCKNKNNCANCKILKKYIKEHQKESDEDES